MRKEVIAEGIDFQGDKYILCWLPAKKEFVSWFLGVGGSNGEEAYYHGHYFFNLNEAVKDFEKRVCIDEEESEVDWKVPANRWNEAQVVLYFELEKTKK